MRAVNPFNQQLVANISEAQTMHRAWSECLGLSCRQWPFDQVAEIPSGATASQAAGAAWDRQQGADSRGLPAASQGAAKPSGSWGWQVLHPDVAGKSGEEDFRQLKEAMRSLTLFLMKEYERGL